MKPSYSLPRFSSVALLAALLLLFITSAFVHDLPEGRLIEGALVTIVLVVGLLAAPGRRSLLAGAGLAVITLAGQWISIAGSDGILRWLYLVPAIAFISLVIARLLRVILTTTEVGFETLCTCIAGFLMIGLLWAMIYTLMGRLTGDAFSFSVPGQVMDGFNAFYFSFVVLSTIGFGDITPVSRVARMCAVMEAITGMFYVAVIVARLVSIHSATVLSRTDLEKK